MPKLCLPRVIKKHTGNPQLTTICLTTVQSYNGLRKGALRPVKHFQASQNIVPPPPWSHFGCSATSSHLQPVAASRGHVLWLFCHFLAKNVHWGSWICLTTTIKMVVKSGPVKVTQLTTATTYKINSSPNCGCKSRTTCTPGFLGGH